MEFVIGTEDETRLRNTIDAALQQLQEIDDVKESLNDLVKTVSTELNIKPADLMQSIKIEYKNKLDDLHAKTDIIDNILTIYRRKK